MPRLTNFGVPCEKNLSENNGKAIYGRHYRSFVPNSKKHFSHREIFGQGMIET